MSPGEPAGGAGGEVDAFARTLARADHLILATPDVDDTADRLATTLGVAPIAGGRHPDAGTRNALLALGDAVYLEIIGPDETAPPPATPRPFGLDEPGLPRLVTWAVRGRSLEALVREARGHGIELGGVRRRTRRRPDGVLLSWEMTDAAAARADGILPFFIDWGATPHPATTSPRGATLTGLRARHPDAAGVRTMLGALGVALEVEPGDAPELIATLATRHGEIVLR